jgi:hypothetical protein
MLQTHDIYRTSLGCAPIKYSEVNFLTPPPLPGPSKILHLMGRAVVGVHTDHMLGTRYPYDVSVLNR